MLDPEPDILASGPALPLHGSVALVRLFGLNLSPGALGFGHCFSHKDRKYKVPGNRAVKVPGSLKLPPEWEAKRADEGVTANLKVRPNLPFLPTAPKLY